MSSIIVRDAEVHDISRVVECVHALLKELSGDPGYALDRAAAENVCMRILIGRESGDIIVAHPEGEPEKLVGCLTIGYQDAVRYGGTFATLEEFWVHPDFRSSGIGARLIDAAVQHFSGYIEVGLPIENFVNFDRTLHFYESQGFARIGPRLRRPPSG